MLAAKQANFKRPSKKGTWLLVSLAVIAVLWFGWIAWEQARVERIQETAHSIISEQPGLKGYPLDTRYLSSSKTLLVSGLVPDQGSEKLLKSRLETALPNTALSLDVGKLPSQPLIPDYVPTKAELAEGRDALRDEIVGILDGRMKAMSETLASIERHLPTAEEVMRLRLSTWLDRQSIRFGRGQQLVDELHADNILRAIADRLVVAPAAFGLRVIGYSDDLGKEVTNMRVSRLRAAVVAGKLRGFGMPSRRLEVLGRGMKSALVTLTEQAASIVVSNSS